MIWGSGGSKSRLAKAAGAEPAGQMRDEKLHAVVARSTFPSQNVQNTPFSDHFWKLRCRKSARRCGAKHILKSKCTKHTRFGPLLEVQMSKKCTPLWREAHFEVKMYKAPQLRTTFGSWDVEKVHAVVARSTFPSQNVQSTTCSRHFWRFGCWKVHAVVARSTFPSQNVQNTTCSRHFSEVRMLKKCTLLWREAHFEVKMYQSTTCSPRHFWRFGCWKSARRCGAKHISRSKCTKHDVFAPLLEVRMLKKCTPLWREAHFEVKMYKTPHVRATFGGSDVASLHYTTLHYTTLHYTTLHYTTLHYTTLQLQLHNYTPLHSTTLNYTTLHYTTLHSTTLHYTTLHYLPLHFTTLHYTPLHYNYNYTTTLHYNILHYTKLHYTTLHYTTLHYTTLHYNTPNDTAPQIGR